MKRKGRITFRTNIGTIVLESHLDTNRHLTRTEANRLHLEILDGLLRIGPQLSYVEIRLAEGRIQR